MEVNTPVMVRAQGSPRAMSVYYDSYLSLFLFRLFRAKKVQKDQMTPVVLHNSTPNGMDEDDINGNYSH